MTSVVSAVVLPVDTGHGQQAGVGMAGPRQAGRTLEVVRCQTGAGQVGVFLNIVWAVRYGSNA